MLNPILTVNYAQSVTVAKSGGDFTSIQAAIDSITDAAVNKPYVIDIYPGIYEENLVLKNYISMSGKGSGFDVVILGTSGTLVTLPSTFSTHRDIVFAMTPTAPGAIVIDAPSSDVMRFINCVFQVTSSTNGVYATVINVDNATLLWGLVACSIFYTMTGSSAGSNTHNMINMVNAKDVILDRVKIDISIADVDDDVNIVNDASTGSLNLRVLLANLNMTNVSYSGTVTAFNHSISGDIKVDTSSTITLTSQGDGTGQIFKVDSTTDDAIIESSTNSYTVTGFDNNYFADVATGDILNSISDQIIASDHYIGAGIINFINSQDYGQIDITGGAEFDIDTTNEWHAFSTPIAGLSSGHIEVAQGSSQAITAYADAGGGVVTVTSNGHGLVD